MSRDLLLGEAQLIGQNFSFWATDESYRHLFGYVYETPEKKYQVDLKFGDDFPSSPPQLFFSQDVVDLLGTAISLDSINQWTPDSHVVDILLEIRLKIQDALTTPKPLPVKPAPQPSAAAPPAAAPSTAAPSTAEPPTGTTGFTGTSSTSATPPTSTPTGEGTQGPGGTPAAPETGVKGTGDGGGEEGVTTGSAVDDGGYITPDLGAYPVDGMDGVQGDIPTWTEDDSPGTVDQLPTWTEDDLQGGTPAQDEPPALPEEKNVAVLEQLAEIQQWFAIDQTGPGRVQIYMTIPTGQTYLVEVDFHDYPAQPVLTLPPGIAEVIGDPYTSFDSLKAWDEGSPTPILSVLQELENRLFSLQDMETEVRMVQGEFDAVVQPNAVGKLTINLMTLGFKKFSLEADVTTFPGRPRVEFSGELKEFLTESIDEVAAYKNWKSGESHVVDVLRDIQWLVEKNSRLDLELQLLKNSIKDTTMQGNTIHVKMQGQMKTKDLTFEFQVTLPSDYPTSAPEIKLLSDLESQPDIEEKIKKSTDEFVESWGTFSYLIDLFNKVSKMIFEVSIIKCILCHQINCPQCGKSISEPDGHTTCPHCERIYHRHCWEQTIASFKKCGFCMRAPPPGFDPADPLPGGSDTVTEY
ncbi:MAG: hypothetical protein ACTSU5_07355 [Promethearchaeota archaeon]